MNIQWDKVAEKLGFKKFVKSPINIKSFLEGWRAFAHTSQPSWEQLGRVLISDYKQKAEQIQQNTGEYIFLGLKFLLL